MAVETQLKNASTAAASAIKAAEPSADTKPAATRKAKAKPAAKKAVIPAKQATPAKAAQAPEPAERRGAFSNEAVITVKSSDHGLRGLRAEALGALKNGMTVAEFKKALAKKEAAGSNRLSTYTGWALKTALAAKLITVK